MIDICIASNNKNKIKQFGEIFEELGVRAALHTAKELGFSDYPPESADTFEGNSYIKAKAVRDYLDAGEYKNYIVVADDSGLCVDALGGEPGVKSARYASKNDIDDASDSENNAKLIGKLKEIEKKDGLQSFTGRYVCAVVALLPSGKKLTAEGEVSGKIVFDPRGNDGFGYDPYFFVDIYGKCFAELTSEERNSISHRGKAVRKICNLIIKEI